MRWWRQNFNSSKVRYKRDKYVGESITEIAISIPPRYGTNTATGRILRQVKNISIPPRYGTNTCLEYYGRFWQSGFQFLQGTVQTENEIKQVRTRCNISIPPRYGTNQSKCRNWWKARYYFNSSKVRYKLEVKTASSYKLDEISIPPRYGTNGEGSSCLRWCGQISIPPRYGTNTSEKCQ